MEKNRTKGLVFALQIIILGVFTWTIKVITDFLGLNLFYVEIISLLLILSGLFLIRRIYSFSYTLRSYTYAWVILILNIIIIIKPNHKLYNIIYDYKFFLIGIMFFLTFKIMEKSLRYFEAWKLSRQWKDFAIITFFGITAPAYILITLKRLGIITLTKIKCTPQEIALIIPIIISFAFFLIYYVCHILKSFKYFYEIEKTNKDFNKH